MKPACETKNPGWREWLLPLAAIVVWCMPAVAINIAHGHQAGSDAAIIFLSIMAVFFTALCALRLERQTVLPMRLLAGLLVVTGVTYNLSNAIGLVAGHSETLRSNALTQQGVRQSLQADLSGLKQQIAMLDAALGSNSTPTLQAEIAELERSVIFDRTKRCTDATLSESREHCARWDKARELLEAAQRRAQLQAQLNAANAELRQAPVRESVDPKAEAVTKALAFIGIGVAADEVRYAMILLPAIVAEVMAAFGAAMCGVRLPSIRRRERMADSAEVATRETVITNAKPEAKEAESLAIQRKAKGKRTPQTPAERTERFIASHVLPGDGDLRSAALYDEFKTWWLCHAPGQPVPSQRVFYLAMTAKGFRTRKRGGVSRYENVRLVPLGVN